MRVKLRLVFFLVWINVSLFGEPDLWDRNKILSGGDLSHYQVPHCIRVFFSFIWFVFIHHNFLNFILNYVLIVTFWIFSSHKIWILLIIYCFIWNYLFFNTFGGVLECCELTGVSLLWTRMALANKVKIGLVFFKLGIYHGVYFDCIIIINLRGYIDLLDTSVIVFVNNLLWFMFYFMLFA